MIRRNRTPVPAAPLPPHGKGMRIGLLGGSFNPPHAAHRMISVAALRKLGLDAVWWLVTPGNPLKDVSALPPAKDRAALARQLARHPRIHVTTVEEQFGTRYSVDTLTILRQRCPDVRFVWLMGADNLAGFHRWARWREIGRMMPIAVFDRPNATFRACSSRTALYFARNRWPEALGRRLADLKPPAWIFFHDRKSPLSSTALRAFARGLH